MSNINDFVRPTNNTSRRDINKILELIHDLVASPAEDEGSQERITHTPHLKLRTTTVTAGGATRIGSNFRDKDNFAWRRQLPTVVKSYPLIHTTNGAGAFDFILDSGETSIYGAFCKSNGTRYIEIANNSILNITDVIGATGWAYIPSIAATTKTLFGIDNTASPYILYTNSSIAANSVIWQIRDSSDVVHRITATIPLNTLFHWACGYNSTDGLRLQIDSDTVQQNSTPTSLKTASGVLGIFAQGAGGSLAVSGTRIMRLSLLHSDIMGISGWITDHINGLLDTDAAEEILTIDLMGNEDPTPDEQSSSCKSS